MIDPHQILIGVGLLIGGAIGGIIGANKMSILKEVPLPINGNGKIVKSTKTEGALHISEEGLDRVLKIEEKYLKEKDHDLLCDSRMNAMRLYIKQELEDNTKTIIKAIKNMGDDSDGAIIF